MEQETHRATRLGLEIVSVLQGLSHQNRVAEANQRPHEDVRGLARIDRLKFARRDTAKSATVTAIGIDIGKNTFHPVGLDKRGGDRAASETITRPGGGPAC